LKKQKLVEWERSAGGGRIMFFPLGTENVIDKMSSLVVWVDIGGEEEHQARRVSLNLLRQTDCGERMKGRTTPRGYLLLLVGWLMLGSDLRPLSEWETHV
jgi:hypothetical protein